MNEYERNALEVIRRWENPEPTKWTKVTQVVGKPFRMASDVVMKIPGVQLVMTKSMEGILSLCGDAAAISVRRTAIFKEFQVAGHQVEKLEDINDIPLETIDRIVGYLDTKYKGIALLEGSLAAVSGAPGIIADIPALIALNMRAVSEYATYYGFDISRPEERLYAMQILTCASTPVNMKTPVLVELTRIANAAMQRKTWSEIGKTNISNAIIATAKHLSLRLTKAKLAQVVPVIASAVAGGYNAKYTADVCEAAYYLYRKRFLIGS